jgi:hypothetical protein
MQVEASAASPPTLTLQSDTPARQLVELCNRFHAELFDWLDRTLPNEPPEHAVALKRAVSDVACSMAERLLYPAYVERPALVPPQLRGEL